MYSLSGLCSLSKGIASPSFGNLFICSRAWHFKRVQRNVTSFSNLLNYGRFTSLPSPMEKPFFLEIFSSKNDLLKYFEAEGELVKSRVQSALFPLPIDTPYLLGFSPWML